jgi:hypothetical protein
MGTGDLPKAGIADVSVNHIEVRVIESVEEFSAELQAETFRDLEVPDAGDIPILLSRTQKNSNA